MKGMYIGRAIRFCTKAGEWLDGVIADVLPARVVRVYSPKVGPVYLDASAIVLKRK
jgi:hypothetical protein